MAVTIRGRTATKKFFLALAAYVVAIIFLLPYLEMVVVAGRPARSF
jgi:hypothetical protein